jgi:hypothetical protein
LAIAFLLCGREGAATTVTVVPDAGEAGVPAVGSIGTAQYGREVLGDKERMENVTMENGGITARRRLTAVNPQFEANPQTGTNVDPDGPATLVSVRAGILYYSFLVHATSGLGNSPSDVRAKLAPYDLQDTLMTCTDYQPPPSVLPPFDGTVAPETGDDSQMRFRTVRFPFAGRFHLCYFAGTRWEELSAEIVVYGANLLLPGLQIWCPLSLINRQVCVNSPETVGCRCLGKVEGTGVGLNPTYPTSRALLIPWSLGTCGTDEPPPGITQNFNNKVSTVTYHPGYEVHDFHTWRRLENFLAWRVCYCVGFNDDDTDEACYSEDTADFQQDIGLLVVTDVYTLMGNRDIEVYPTLRFSIEIRCSSDFNGEGFGACSDLSGMDGPRFKIVRRTVEADRPYYDPDSGCRYLQQAATVAQGAMILGGHVAPENCDGPANCAHYVTRSNNGKSPTWDDIQIDASYENAQMVVAEYDVCYCDQNCINSMYWFKVGQFTVHPVVTSLTTDPNCAVNTGYLAVNTGGYICMYGQGDQMPGSWSAPSETTNQMKILEDTYAHVDKASCFDVEQPTTVSGTERSAWSPRADENNDFEPTGLLYGRICGPEDANGDRTCVPNIRMAEAGWYAVCYCDKDCNEMLSWSVFGRFLISGPTSGQEWTVYAGVTFNLRIRGWALNPNNRIQLLSYAYTPADCGRYPAALDRADGPADTATLMDKTSTDALVTEMLWHPDGTEIVFSRDHQLSDGDYILINGVNTLADEAYIQDMYNNVHEVFVANPTKIRIPVRFPGQLPTITNMDSLRDTLSWTRTSEELFTNIRVKYGNPSQEGRGYVVCWSPGDQTSSSGPADADFVGQVGTIRAKDPVLMTTAKIGLTTVRPDSTAPVVIAFTTGDIAYYSTATGMMQLVIANASQPGTPGDVEVYIEPRKWNLDVLEPDTDHDTVAEATQAFCGELIIELYTADPDGFPMPYGCFYDEDNTDPSQKVSQIHILFSPRNHLKRNTEYMMVLNMMVKAEDTGIYSPGLTRDRRPIYIWSMDDVHNNPYEVIELGRTAPSPENRVPPRDDATGLLQLTDPAASPAHPMFDPADGFKITPDPNSQTRQMSDYCSNDAPARSCSPCQSEQDCGNGDANTPPSPERYCISPVDPNCPGFVTLDEAFYFSLKAKSGNPIKQQEILRVFLHPLLQWDINNPCPVSMHVCAISSGDCSAPQCSSESVIDGNNQPTVYRTNIMRITLPVTMDPIANAVVDTIKVHSIPLPPGGFFPQIVTAELMQSGGANGITPDYWDPRTVTNFNGATLYKQPKVLAASLVVNVDPLVNPRPFRGDTDNKFYARLVFGTNIFRDLEDVTVTFRLPVGYDCAQHSGPEPQGVAPNDLVVLQGLFPSTNGRFGGGSFETQWRPDDVSKTCNVDFQANMVVYGGSVIFIEIPVDNPATPLKSTAPTNYWNITVSYGSYLLPDYTMSNIQLRPCTAPQYTKLLCEFDLGDSYGASMSVLGLLSGVVIAPGNFGAREVNTLSIFFMTEQEVGSISSTNTEVWAEIWVNAPPTFEFGQYCAADQLPDTYYIPEGATNTQRIPAGSYIECAGSTTNADQLTYNRAIVSTRGRLRGATAYGFTLQVTNGLYFLRSQLDEWTLRTYTAAGVAVDGSYYTARFNARDAEGPDMSFGIYQRAMPPSSFVVNFDSRRPGTSTITILPIIVSTTMQRPVRILAPAGYLWDCAFFRYKAPGAGVPSSLVVEGAEADMPINDGPPTPNAEPRNRISLDTLQAPWVAGVVYGFVTQILVPGVAPTGSANQFSIEFGYTGEEDVDRIEAGVADAPLVQRLINGGVTAINSIVGSSTVMTFSVRTVTAIPTAGGLVIVGPPGFTFEPLCHPKQAVGFPELPYDATCLFHMNRTSLQPRVSIVAGISGIAPGFYRFMLAATNPPQRTNPGVSPGTWVFNAYSLVSEELVLDFSTSVTSYPIGIAMTNATLRMSSPKPPPGTCNFPTDTTLGSTQTVTCDFEYWPWYPPRGNRDDRPGQRNELIILMQLEVDCDTDQDITVRAPVGYVFSPECRALGYPSSQIFDNTLTNPIDLPVLPDEYAVATELGWTTEVTYVSRYTQWPEEAEITSCLGNGNIATISVLQGLRGGARYLFKVSEVTNPPATPEVNTFVLEFNGEASLPFPGIEIWAFTNGSVVPTTTAASTQDLEITNLVTLQLRPVNMLPTGGLLRIYAPSGFLIPTDCDATITFVDEGLDITNRSTVEVGQAQTNMERYMFFRLHDGDYSCQGDKTPSNAARLTFSNHKYLQRKVLYSIRLVVINPQTITSERELWSFESVQNIDGSLFSLDTSQVPGFRINRAVQAFQELRPTSINANVDHQLEFNISFPDTVMITDKIYIVAPITFFFSKVGNSACPRYVYLDGSLRRTIPTCEANTITWHLQEESVPALSGIRFLVQVTNPPVTPTPMNLFQVRHTYDDNTVKSSRMIDGYEIIPLLTAPVVSKIASTSLSCRPIVNIRTDFPCQAAGSRSSMRLTFSTSRSAQIVQVQGRVGQEQFDMTGANFGDTIPVYARTATRIAAQISLGVSVPVTFVINGMVNPQALGTSYWTIATFTTDIPAGMTTTTTIMPLAACGASGECGALPYLEQRREETADLASVDFVVLGYLGIRLSSRVSPQYYDSRAATITFEVVPQFNIRDKDVLRISRPPSPGNVNGYVPYSFVNGTLSASLGELALSFGEHGVDSRRVWSGNLEDYFAVIVGSIASGSLMVFTIQADLPTLPPGSEMYNVWYMRTYVVMPRVDPEDGEVLDTSMPLYPWIDPTGTRRTLQQRGSSDGSFPGFILVGPMLLRVTPSLRTPGAETTILLEFGFDQPEQANTSLIFEVTGPAGYFFMASCLAERNLFRKCIGNNNRCSLEPVARRSSRSMPVLLNVRNPEVTPVPNRWTVELFKDGSTQYVRRQQVDGEDLESMSVTYKGNNQMGEAATGFFSFTPISSSPTAAVRIIVTPPPNQGYNVMCTGVSPLGFVDMPDCSAGGVNQPLTLIFSNASVLANRSYTFGVRIYNPGGRPQDDQNYWGLSLQDGSQQTFDALLRIPGLQLMTMPLRVNGIGWTSAVARLLNTVLVQLRVVHNIGAGLLTEFRIRAPEGVMYNEEPNMVRILPLSLPLRVGRPTQVAGDLLTLNLDGQRDIEARLYNIRFEVSNPSIYPHDNTWSIVAMRNNEAMFSHVVAGYVEGVASPFDLSMTLSATSGASRGLATCWSIVVTGMAVFAAIRLASP